ncbi:hypothetical protein ACFQ6Q_16395 [Streptomyces sp. NPDC056437]|uniref:hypothetical protein n=1 Tax=Streptomyces sp. NPDC056437 TaxID=3345816 RepID=UPI0036763E83
MVEEAKQPAPRRHVVEQLWLYYEAAGRPPLRTITEAVVAAGEGPVSKETIRRLLQGVSLCSWSTVYFIVNALLHIGPPAEGLEKPVHRGPSSAHSGLYRAWAAATEAAAERGERAGAGMSVAGHAAARDMQ